MADRYFLMTCFGWDNTLVVSDNEEPFCPFCRTEGCLKERKIEEVPDVYPMAVVPPDLAYVCEKNPPISSISSNTRDEVANSLKPTSRIPWLGVTRRQIRRAVGRVVDDMEGRRDG